MKNTFDRHERVTGLGLDPSRKSVGGLGRILSAGLCGAGGLALLGMLAFYPGEELSASQSTIFDNDNDGLPNRLELGQYTSPDNADSDVDGFGDGEEMARGSSGTKFYLVPLKDEVSMGLGVYVDGGGGLQGVAAVFVPDGVIGNKSFNIGLYLGGRAQPSLLPQRTYVHQIAIKSQQVGAHARVYFFYFPLSKALVQLKGSLSYFVTLSEAGKVVAADAVDLIYSQGAVLEVVNIERKSEVPGGNSVPGKPGQIIRPVGGSPIPDVGWVSGALCYQDVEVVGFVGSVVTQQVVNASCQQGWDGLCDPAGCAGSVGGTIETLDPGVLIGG
jgi:hypothetical protein